MLFRSIATKLVEHNKPEQKEIHPATVKITSKATAIKGLVKKKTIVQPNPNSLIRLQCSREKTQLESCTFKYEIDLDKMKNDSVYLLEANIILKEIVKKITEKYNIEKV